MDLMAIRSDEIRLVVKRVSCVKEIAEIASKEILCFREMVGVWLLSDQKLL